MKRIHLLTVAALAVASSPAFASSDVDFYPNGFLSDAIRATQAHAQRAAIPARAVGAADANAAFATASKSRGQVVGETREAARLGLLNQSEAGAAEPTAEQSRQIEQAGSRAVGIASTSR